MEQNQEKAARRRTLIFLSLVAFGSVFTLFFLAFQGNRDQTYHDILIEFTAIFSSNKSAEQNLLYLLAAGGAFLYTLYFLWSKKKYKDVFIIGRSAADDQTVGKYFLWGTAVLVGVYYLAYYQIDPVWLTALIFGVILYGLDPGLVLSGLCFFFLAVYGVCGLYRGYVFLGGQGDLSSITAAMLALIPAMLLLLGGDKKRTLVRGCLLAQLCVPGTLLVYFASSYTYQGQQMIFPITGKAKCAVGLVLFLFVLEAAWILVRSWKHSRSVNEIIAYGACVSIMAFNRYSGTGAVMSMDLHHPFENIIGYSQMAELGQKAFSQYIPVSGMYSLLQGAVFKLFGHGQFGHYNLTQNLFYLFIILLLAALLMCSMDRVYVLLTALLILVFDYNRIVFILPIMLLLTLPKLVERKNLWLKAWMLSSLFHGLYYPVFGAAVCVGFLPLGLCQIWEFIHSGEFKKQARKASFWLAWLACFLPVLLAVPWLWGTYKHIRAMGGQSMLTNGISRFGQIIQGNFLPYLMDYPGVRLVLYNLLTFMVPAVFVWFVAALALKTADIRFQDGKIQVKNKKEGCMMLSSAIVLLISCTYTFVRLDVNDLYARNVGVFFAGLVMLIVLANRYLKDSAAKYAVMFTACFLPATVPWVGFLENDHKLEASYPVEENYVLVLEDKVEALGRGFMAPSVYEQLQIYDQWLEEGDREESYMGIAPSFGHYYLLGLKGDGAMEMTTIKSLEAAKETIQLVKENQTVIGSQFDPFRNYYIYHWLITSGYYGWSEEKQRFFPNAQVWDEETIRREHKDAELSWDEFALGKNAASLGQSMDSLAEIFSQPELELEFPVSSGKNSIDIQFSREIEGDEADFLYLEFSGLDESFLYTQFNLYGEMVQTPDALSKYFMKKSYHPGMQVVVSWRDDQGKEHSMNCDMCRGKLLIPLGSGLKWLLNRHSGLSVSVLQNFEEISVPELREARLLKLREAE